MRFNNTFKKYQKKYNSQGKYMIKKMNKLIQRRTMKDVKVEKDLLKIKSQQKGWKNREK